jgi:hypothetical protein
MSGKAYVISQQASNTIAKIAKQVTIHRDLTNASIKTGKPHHDIGRFNFPRPMALILSRP